MIKKEYKKIVISLVILLSILLFFLFIIKIKSSAEDLEAQLEVGKNAYISNIINSGLKTGTTPFDSDDAPGNDSSIDNNIVRTYDSFNFTTEFDIASKTSTQLKGGIIVIKGELPSDLKGNVEWMTDDTIMSWAEDVILSSDKLTFEAKYHMNESSVNYPGKQSLIYGVRIFSLNNGTIIKPKITLSIYGNEDSEKKSIDITPVVVSGKYNFQIKNTVQPSWSYSQKTVNYTINGITNSGRLTMYGVTAEMFGDNNNKGLKGLMLPNSKTIEYDMKVTVTRKHNTTGAVEDVTDTSNWLVADYGFNNGKLGTNKVLYMDLWRIPDAENSAPTYRRVPEGTMTLTKNNILHITSTVNNYINTFPIRGKSEDNGTTIEKRRGIFMSEGIFIIVPQSGINDTEDYTYTVNATILNPIIKDNSNNNISTNSIITSQNVHDDFLMYSPLTANPWNYNNNQSNFGMNNGYLQMNSSVSSRSGYSSITYDAGKDIHTVEILAKIWGNIKPTGAISYGHFPTYFKYNRYFVTKKDGSDWTNLEEYRQGNVSSLTHNFYTNINDIPSDAKIIAVLFETTEGKIPGINSVTRDGFRLDIAMTPNDKAKAGEVAHVHSDFRIWVDALDRNIYSVTKGKTYQDFPSPSKVYIKSSPIIATYTDNGSTTSGSATNGRSFLIRNGDLVLKKYIYKNNTDNTNTSIDFSKGEYEITYKLVPTITKRKDADNIVLRIEDTIPSGLTYINSSSNVGDPIITKNSNGSSLLKWYIYGVDVNKTITPITYKVSVDPTATNNTKYSSTAYLFEEYQQDGDGNKIIKVGNYAYTTNNYSTAEVAVINLSSYSLFTENNSQLIEKNKTATFINNFMNKSDKNISNFVYLDILPYNGDSRGNNFNGDYTSSIGVVSSDSFNIYYTTNTNVRTKTAKTINISDGSWTLYTGGNINAVAYAIVGNVSAKNNLQVNLKLNTIGNNSKDIYVNNATAKINDEGDAMVSSSSEAKVIYREINGKVYYDANYNDVLDSEEVWAPQGLKVYLLDENDNLLDSTTTDFGGNYKFENLGKSNYKVKIQYYSRQYVPVKANIGSNPVINSKFNIHNTDSSTSYTITSLNSSKEANIIEKNVNLGLQSKIFTIKLSINGQGNSSGDQNISFGNNSDIFTITPDKGYKVKNIIIDGTEKKFTTNSDNTVTIEAFKNVTSNHNIEVTIDVKNDIEGLPTFHLDTTELLLNNVNNRKIKYHITVIAGEYNWTDSNINYEIYANQISLIDIHKNKISLPVSINNKKGSLDLSKQVDDMSLSGNIDININGTNVAGEYRGNLVLQFITSNK